MAATENEAKLERAEVTEVAEMAEERKKKFTPLLLLAIPLSLGSLTWTTFSLLDFFQVGGIDPRTMRFEDLSIVGLSAAATADIGWSATMVAEYRGVRLTRSRLGFGGRDQDQKNLLPYIGWAEVLLVTLMLALHGKDMGNGEAVFAAALPILTKLSWMMVIADLRDPSDLTDEMKLTVAEKKQRAKMRLAESEATAEEHKANLEAQRRQHEAELERKRAEAEKLKLDEQTKLELEEMKLRGETGMKLLKQRLHTELQMEMLNGQRDIEVMRADFEQDMALRTPLFSRQTITGNIVRQGSQRAIEGGMEALEGVDAHILAGQGLKQSELKKALMALSFYTVNAQRGGGVTKKAWCAANNVEHPSRLTEATTDFPEEWFQVRGLATWTSAQN